jgi:hypothetical protein
LHLLFSLGNCCDFLEHSRQGTLPNSRLNSWILASSCIHIYKPQNPEAILVSKHQRMSRMDIFTSGILDHRQRAGPSRDRLDRGEGVDFVFRASRLWVVITSLQCCQCRSLFLNASLVEAQEHWQYVRPHSAAGRYFLFYFRDDNSLRRTCNNRDSHLFNLKPSVLFVVCPSKIFQLLLLRSLRGTHNACERQRSRSPAKDLRRWGDLLPRAPISPELRNIQ